MTHDAAKIAFVGDDLGTVGKGKLADLIVARGDPLADPRPAADVRRVIKNGRVYSQDGILGPARTPQQLAARRLVLEAQEKMCRADPHACEEAGGHAH